MEKRLRRGPACNRFSHQARRSSHRDSKRGKGAEIPSCEQTHNEQTRNIRLEMLIEHGTTNRERKLS